MGLRADHVDGREARVGRAPIAVDLPNMRRRLAPTEIGHRPKTNRKRESERDAEHTCNTGSG